MISHEYIYGTVIIYVPDEKFLRYDIYENEAYFYPSWIAMMIRDFDKCVISQNSEPETCAKNVATKYADKIVELVNMKYPIPPPKQMKDPCQSRYGYLYNLYYDE
ncbi:MAG: hypothetical protein QXP36_00890 [Conexivisphaerales archaeon]